MEIFKYIGNSLYGIEGTSFSPSPTSCQIVNFAQRIGISDYEEINLPFAPYFGRYFIQNGILTRQPVPTSLSTFNLVNTTNYRGSIGFWANGNQIISHVGAGQFQLSINNGITWSNLATANVAGIAGYISSSLKNNFYENMLVGTSNLNSWAYFSNPNWFVGNMPGNNTWNAVYRSRIGPIRIAAVGYGVMAYNSVGETWATSPIDANRDWKALVGVSDNWIALDTGGTITKSVVPWTTWSTPQQLFTIGVWNVDLDVIQGSQGYRFVAVGYSVSNATAELYISNVVPNNNAPNNISWSKINIPNGRWFKINNKSSTFWALATPSNTIYITEDPNNNTSQNRALVSSDFGESWNVISLPTQIPAAKGSIMYADKISSASPYIRWFVSNGIDFPGQPPPKLYSGQAILP